MKKTVHQAGYPYSSSSAFSMQNFFSVLNFCKNFSFHRFENALQNMLLMVYTIAKSVKTSTKGANLWLVLSR